MIGWGSAKEGVLPDLSLLLGEIRWIGCYQLASVMWEDI